MLVDISAAGVHARREDPRRGVQAHPPYKAPFVLGHDLAGIVTRVGSAVSRFSVGDEVDGRPRDGRIGTFAQLIAVHEDDLATKPASLSMAAEPSVPLVALTAWQALVERAHLKPGQKALIHAGSGGVGTYAIQLVSIGVTDYHDGRRQCRMVGDLGADVVIDCRRRSSRQSCATTSSPGLPGQTRSRSPCGLRSRGASRSASLWPAGTGFRRHKDCGFRRAW